jgi:G3E family GTPase
MIKSKTVERIPVVVLSGFLGSGKTTLLNRLLQFQPHSAVIINEFGATPIDQQLIKERNIPLTTLSGGCLCCQVRGSLAPLLKNLRMAWDGKSDKPFSRIFIETSGVASPEPILDTLLNERWLSTKYHYQGMIATVSATAADDYLNRFPEAQAQIAWADKLVITQTDLADSGQIRHLHDRLKELAPATPRLEVIKGEFDPEVLLNFGGKFRAVGSLAVIDGPDHGFSSISLHFDQPMAWPRLHTVLENLLDEHREHIVRLKGVVFTLEHNQPMVVHGITGRLFPPVPLPNRAETGNRGRLVLITTGEIKGLAEDIMTRLREQNA